VGRIWKFFARIDTITISRDFLTFTWAGSSILNLKPQLPSHLLLSSLSTSKTTTTSSQVDGTIMKDPLPIPDQLEKQLAKCKSIRDADTYYKSREKTAQVRFVFSYVCQILVWDVEIWWGTPIVKSNVLLLLLLLYYIIWCYFHVEKCLQVQVYSSDSLGMFTL
jgi:hypothetical protein